MKSHGKRFKNAMKNVDLAKEYVLRDAVELVKKMQPLSSTNRSMWRSALVWIPEKPTSSFAAQCRFLTEQVNPYVY